VRLVLVLIVVVVLALVIGLGIARLSSRTTIGSAEGYESMSALAMR